MDSVLEFEFREIRNMTENNNVIEKQVHGIRTLLIPDDLLTEMVTEVARSTFGEHP